MMNPVASLPSEQTRRGPLDFTQIARSEFRRFQWPTAIGGALAPSLAPPEQDDATLLLQLALLPQRLHGVGQTPQIDESGGV
ncbi:hypothetical protein, partial [Pseudoflavonifractor sp. An187]|uniref:hypothetical protein n=1 Tax=Pseudoflavonifractor sp. An187 TaxID=1965578 RepID=UPI0019529C6F